MKPHRILRVLIVALAMTSIMAGPVSAQVFLSFGIGITIGTPPPPIPVYYLPPVPAPNYIWQPGYWAWGPYGYYWVPGCWVPAPYVGYLWTPGYWGWSNGYYSWNPGYWATSIGFYGGINYGGGYYGNGYYGGRWSGSRFYYNTYVSNVPGGASWARGRVYNNRSVYYANRSHTSYNGGPGGLSFRPTSGQLAVAHLHHIGATPAQMQHLRIASQDHSLLAGVNHGKPPVLTATRPLTTTHALPGFTPTRPQDRTLLTHYVVHTTHTTGGPGPTHTMAPRVYHPTSTYHAPTHTTAPRVYHPASTYHAPTHTTAPRVYHPVSTYHAPIHTPAPQYHPPAPQYHPAVHVYHAPPRPPAPPPHPGGPPPHPVHTHAPA